MRELARAAGLRARTEDKAWLPVGELRKAVLEHLAPERNTVPAELVHEMSEDEVNQMAAAAVAILHVRWQWISAWLQTERAKLIKIAC